MGRILLACAVAQECAPLLDKECAPLLSAEALPLTIGRREAHDLGPALVVVCGVGKVNTAQALTAALEAGGFEAVVSFGSAGAFPGSGLTVGDVALAAEEISDELVVLPARLATLEEIGLPLPGRLPADPGLTEQLAAACRQVNLEPKVGPFLTVSRITSSMAEAQRLTALLGPVLGPLLAESMEGAAAAQVAAHYGLPFAEVRGVANLIDDRERQVWDFQRANAACCRVLAAFLAKLTRRTP